MKDPSNNENESIMIARAIERERERVYVLSERTTAKLAISLLFFRDCPCSSLYNIHDTRALIFIGNPRKLPALPAPRHTVIYVVPFVVQKSGYKHRRASERIPVRFIYALVCRNINCCILILPDAYTRT